MQQNPQGNSRTTEGRGRLYNSIVDTIGDTPCIRINRLAPKGVEIYVKAEFFNPAASVKDRLAISIIEEAEKRGDLKPGQTVWAEFIRQQLSRTEPRCHNGGQLLNRTAQAHALSRCQGRTHAAGSKRVRHVPKGKRAG